MRRKEADGTRNDMETSTHVPTGNFQVSTIGKLQAVFSFSSDSDTPRAQAATAKGINLSCMWQSF
jgi:hypothetical protein